MHACKSIFCLFIGSAAIMLWNSCKLNYRMPYEKLEDCGHFLSKHFEPDTAQWHVVVLSSPYCGYCWVAKRSFKKQGLYASLPVTWVEADSLSASFRAKAREAGWYEDTNVLQLDDCTKRVKMMPVFLLYRQGKKRPVYIVKGWYPDTGRRLLRYAQRR